jgi:hypothetical protein
MMENAYPYLTKNNTNETDLESLSISNPQTYFTIHYPEGNDRMNNSVSNFVEAFNPNQNSTDTSCDSPALFHHGVPVGTYKVEIVAASRKEHP